MGGLVPLNHSISIVMYTTWRRMPPPRCVQNRRCRCCYCRNAFVTGPPTHSVGGRLVTVAGVCRRLWSSSVTLHGDPAGGFIRASQTTTSCRLQSNYSSTVTLHGGPVVLRPVRATPCFVIYRAALSYDGQLIATPYTAIKRSTALLPLVRLPSAVKQPTITRLLTQKRASDGEDGTDGCCTPSALTTDNRQ